MLQRRLVSAAERRCRYDRSRRNHFLLPQRKLESGAGRCRGRDRRHSGGFLLRIMPPSWHPVPACIPRLRCRRAILLCSNDGAASIPKFGPEIKNRCTQKVVFGEILASIPKSSLEIKNRCTQQGLNREILASIPKFGLEIKNRCSSRVKSRENRVSILKSEPEIKNRCTQEDLNRENPAATPKFTP